MEGRSRLGNSADSDRSKFVSTTGMDAEMMKQAEDFYESVINETDETGNSDPITTNANTADTINNANSDLNQVSIPENLVPANSTPLSAQDAPWIRNDVLRIVIVDQQKDVEEMAREAAHRRLEAEIADDRKKLGLIKNIFKNGIWKGSFGRELIIERYRREALANIKAGNNILANHEISEQKRDEVNQITMARFMQEGDEMIHKMAGESKQFIDGTTEAGAAMRKMIYGLLEEKMRQPDIEPGSFDELIKAKIFEYQRQYNDESLIRRGNFYLNNIASIADIAREKAEHLAIIENIDRDEAIRQVLAEVEIYTGESRNTARSEMRLSKTEKLIDRLNKEPKISRLLVKPEIVASGVALASGVINFAFKSVSRTASSVVIPVLGGAFVSGVISGAEESYRQEEARNLQQRQLAQGGDVASLTDVERKRLEKFSYETVTASEIIEDFELGFSKLPDLRPDLSPEDEKTIIDVWVAEQQAKFAGDPADFTADLAAILHNEISHVAYTNSRINVSDKNKLDLIHYDSLEEMQQQRWDIDVKKAQMNVLLQKIMSVRPELATEIFTNDGIKTTGDLKQDYRTLVGTIEDAFNEGAENDIDSKDKAFRNFKRKRVLQKVMVGTATGLAIGVAFQEVRAFFDDSLHGVIEGMSGKQQYSVGAEVEDTLLARMTGLRAEKLADVKTGFLEQELQNLGSPNNVEGIKLDGGFQMVADKSSGGIDIVDKAGKVVVDDLRFDGSGNLTKESLAALRDSGFKVDINSATVVDKLEKVAKKVSTKEFINQNRSGMVRTSINYWYDNDTLKFDQNELRMDWQVGKNGEIKLLTNRMAQGGSFHDGKVADISLRKIFISASRSSQKLNFSFKPDVNGTVTIKPGSEAYKLFKVTDGKISFKGGFIQVANELGLNDKGETMIAPLASLAGEDSFKGFTTTETVKHLKQVFDYAITAPELKVDLGVDMAIPPFIPIYARRELPPIKYNKAGDSNPQIGDLGYYMSEPDRDQYYNTADDKASASDRINRDRQSFYPTVERQALGNDLGRIMQWYDHEIEQHNGKQYAEWVQKKVTESKLDQLSPETKAILQIPVYAAGESEANKLGDILQRGYAEQIKQNKQQKQVAIFLNVNWRYQDQNDPQKLANIQKTVDAVKQFQAKNPDIQVYPIFNTFTDSQLKASGNAINQITKHNTDILLSAMGKNVREGRVAQDFNPLLIRNDADAEALDKNYFRNIIRMADNSPDTEIFSGVTYFDRKLAERNPVLSLSLEMLQALNIYAKARGNIHTAGANFAYRAKSVAETGFGINARMFGVGLDDMQFGRLIKRKRAVAEADGQTFDGNLGRLVGNARLMTNADRQEQSYINGKNSVDPWSDEGSFYDENGNYVGRNRSGNGTSQLKNDIDLLKLMSESEAKEEIKKRLEHNISLVLHYNSKDNYRYGKIWLKSYLGIANEQDSEQYFSIKDSKIVFTEQGVNQAYDRLIKNNVDFCQFLQKKTDYWNVL
ncbi:MAG: hypothetical protein Q3996_00670 [Candidatus Saccharibacteria bacterium]|nr:hypothetical protein [Candidatus Saccharibacteria bacterium]